MAFKWVAVVSCLNCVQPLSVEGSSSVISGDRFDTKAECMERAMPSANSLSLVAEMMQPVGKAGKRFKADCKSITVPDEPGKSTERAPEEKD